MKRPNKNLEKFLKKIKEIINIFIGVKIKSDKFLNNIEYANTYYLIKKL